MDIVNEKIDVYNRIRWYNLIEKRIRRVDIWISILFI
jgi:hypothetical protein